MAAIDVITSMRGRMPWPVARRVLKTHELSRSLGWPRTVSRVQSGDDEYEEKESELQDALEEHIMCGEKIVRLFEADDDEIEHLREASSALAVPVNPMSQRYPLLVDDTTLRQQQAEPPLAIANVAYEEGTALVLGSVRFLTTREIMQPAELSDAAALDFEEYSEIIAIRRRRLEALDVLWIPAEGNYIELRVDFPLGMHRRQGVQALNAAEARFESLLGGSLGEQVNLFPVIQSLYEGIGDGAMVELGFMVSGSAQKLEKTRRDGQCCREEAYHLGGVGALDAPIQPYRASVMWSVDLGNDVTSYPEVSILGTSIQTAEATPFLGEMIVSNCAGFIDYDFVRDRIVDHVEGL